MPSFQSRGVSQANNLQEVRNFILIGLHLDNEDGSSKHLRNINELVPEYTAVHPEYSKLRGYDNGKLNYNTKYSSKLTRVFHVISNSLFTNHRIIRQYVA
jgi:hypothetical protein